MAKTKKAKVSKSKAKKKTIGLRATSKKVKNPIVKGDELEFVERKMPPKRKKITVKKAKKAKKV